MTLTPHFLDVMGSPVHNDDHMGATGTPRAAVSVAVVIATAYRNETLRSALGHLTVQCRLPRRVIVADGAESPGAQGLVDELTAGVPFTLEYLRCTAKGAAAQRNEAAQLVTEDVILFMDDDLYPEPDCFAEMLKVLDSDMTHGIGGVGAIFTNQHYREPSPLFKRWLDFLAGEKADSYAGRVIGPAVNIAPPPSDDGRVTVVEWLNSGCTAYRREAFEAERFSPRFYGYSMFEDVHLSLRVGKHSNLVVATAAKAFHDSQPAAWKSPFKVAKMSVTNRYLVMTEVLGRTDLKHHIKFLLLIPFGLFCQARRIRSLGDVMRLLQSVAGYWVGLWRVLFRRGDRAAGRNAGTPGSGTVQPRSAL